MTNGADYLDPAIGIPLALVLWAWWGYLIWKDRHAHR